jgi:putative tricarboxylic transport membrane protein
MAAHRLRWNNRLFLPFFLLVMTAVYAAAAFQIQPQFSEGVAGPRFVPLLAAFLTFAALARVIWRDLAEEGKDIEGGILEPLLIVLVMVLYVFAFTPLGYGLSTFLFVFALFHLFHFEEGRIVIRVLYTIAVTAVFYGMFAVAFGIRLPALMGVI